MFVFLKNVPLRFHICSLKGKETKVKKQKTKKPKNICHNERIKDLDWLLSVQYLMDLQAMFLGSCGSEKPLQSGP